MSFQQPYPPFTCPSGDGRNIVLQDYLYYHATDGSIFRCIKGSTSDGASTPRSIWNIYPPFGAYWLAAILHDCAYRATLEKQKPDGTWYRVQLSLDESNSLLLEAMASLGVNEVDQQVIYNAVKDFAARAFENDLAEPIRI